MEENKKISQFPQALIAKDTYKIPILDGFLNKIVNWLVLKNDAVTEARSDIVLTHYYDTGWKLNLLNGGVSADWTNVHLGDDNTQDSNVNHALNCGLNQLLIKLLISTDGTDTTSFELAAYCDAGSTYGYQNIYIDDNNIKIQTRSGGIGTIMADNGGATAITNQAYYYRIIVVKLF